MARRLSPLVILALSAASVPAAALAQDQETVEWRVKDRFRLFDQAGQGRAAAEDLMQRIGEASPAAPLATFYEPFLDTLSSAKAAAPAGDLRRSNYTQVDDGSGRRSGRYNADYLWPERYSIELRVKGAAEGELCTYTSSVDRASEKPCRAWTPLAVARGPDVSNRGWTVAAEVAVSRASGERRIPIEFRDELIVALGDSYISGEGNPDRPSKVTARPDPVFSRYSWGGRLSPGQVEEAIWWDEPCHRSLLSWPVLASLAHAARNPHKAVTLVHLGCSGAVSPELHHKGQRDLPGGGNEPEPQLKLLSDLLVAPSAAWAARRVDTAFLSIGGNDIGFAGVIATIALPANGYTFGWLATRAVGASAGAVCPYDSTGTPLTRLCSTKTSSQARLERLPGELVVLAERLKAAGIPLSRTFQPLYPNPLLTADGAPCDTNPSEEEAGFEALMGIVPGIFRGPRFRTWNFELMYVPEGRADPWEGQSGWLDGGGRIGCDWAPEGDDSEVCQALWVHASLNKTVAKVPWRPFGGHLEEMAKRGLCNSSPANPRALPLVEAGTWRNGLTPGSINPYDPASPRWFRLPNDSVLAQYGWHGKKRYFHQGTVHPTFRGHLEIAEAAYEAAFRTP